MLARLVVHLYWSLGDSCELVQRLVGGLSGPPSQCKTTLKSQSQSQSQTQTQTQTQIQVPVRSTYLLRPHPWRMCWGIRIRMTDRFHCRPFPILRLQQHMKICTTSAQRLYISTTARVHTTDYLNTAGRHHGRALASTVSCC